MSDKHRWPKRSTLKEREARRRRRIEELANMTPEQRAVSEANIKRFREALEGPGSKLPKG